MSQRISSACVCAVATWLLHAVPHASGQATEFDFKDPKGVNSAQFLLDSEVEPIMGVAAGISGKLSYDPADPKKTSGKIVVDARTLHTPNERMNEVLHSAEWMDVEQFSTIEFEFKQIREVRDAKNGARELLVAGDFTCRGVTKQLAVPVRVSYLPGKLKSRMRGDGDLLLLRAEFSIKRKDFGIKNDMDGVVVAEDVQVRVLITGTAAKK
ncbi:MAG: Protein YceI [Phycisphaerae bacterium]|nr:Protein YceI [Phycisphaerae bacterium]